MSKGRRIREWKWSVVNAFKILIAFSLRKREEDASKGGVNDCRWDHEDKCSKSMNIRSSKGMGRKFC